MLYAHTLVIPANTLPGNPLDGEMGITGGTIERLAVYFPWGCAGLAGCQVLYGSWQILPQTRGQWLTGNDNWLGFEEYMSIKGDPLFLTFRGYNLDDTYEHSLTLHATVLRPEVGEEMARFLRTLG